MVENGHVMLKKLFDFYFTVLFQISSKNNNMIHSRDTFIKIMYSVIYTNWTRKKKTYIQNYTDTYKKGLWLLGILKKINSLPYIGTKKLFRKTKEPYFFHLSILWVNSLCWYVAYHSVIFFYTKKASIFDCFLDSKFTFILLLFFFQGYIAL